MAPPSAIVFCLPVTEGPGSSAPPYLDRLRAVYAVKHEPADGNPRQPDLVVLELQAATDDSWTRLREVAAAHPGVPLIATAEHADQALLCRARELGAEDCVAWGSDGGELLVRVAAMVLERAQLRAREATFRDLIDKSTDALLVIDKGGIIRFANRTARGVLAGQDEELVGRPFGHPTPAGRVAEVEITPMERTAVVAEMHVAETTWDGGPASLVTLRDVTRQRRLVEDLREACQRDQHRARHDPLTGLPNRDLLLERLHQAAGMARSQERVVVYFIDLDGFKEINDTLGHAAGDEVLRETAGRLLACVRGSDTVARLGGDEFVIVLAQVEAGFDAAEVARKVRRLVNRPYQLSGRRAGLSASIGISLAPEDGLDADTLLRKADLAMYRAKRLGKNSFQFYDRAMDDAGGDRPAGQARLWQALDQGELRVHYQPQLDLRTGLVSGVEALVRWQHPERGLLRPGEFMPLAEASDLAAAIDRWVLATACSQARAWKDDGYALLRVGVNLSARHLLGGRLPGEVEELLRRTGTEPHLLALEVAEQQVLQGPTQAAAALAELRHLGVRLVIDDFGSGLGSLTALKRLPIDGLKIDRSVVQALPADGASAAITTAIVELAHHLCLQVLAEGVESARQLEFLRSIHCDAAQGFHCGRPQPHAPLAGLLSVTGRPGRVLVPPT